ncbi:MAG: helix-turn-helix domain-containing protein [Gemmatimonadetes bacterium]|nr:helix-turn-helix domain-containing protein [Gemmatimonadota bacterium]MYE93377.1 helix-turn-helix domain-containing protein [Gemmatimonadota bacterium]MYJ12247.1 helix-turn-helix domain-containing protein [Gemmatimonadota bacterium]
MRRLDMACLPALRPEMSWNDSVSWALLTFSKTLPEKRTSSIGAPVSRTSALRDLRTARFADIYERWTSGQISQAHAAHLLEVSERTFQRYVVRYRETGLRGLEDRRTTNPRRAPDEEVAALLALYEERYMGWSIRKFYRAYTDSHGGTRSYTCVKNRLHESGLVTPRRSTRSTPEGRGRRPAEGRLLHQASCVYQWLPKQTWELVALVDDASDRVHAGLFVESETIWCRFRTIYETIVAKGLFDAIHVDAALRNSDDCRETGRFPDAMRKLQISVLPSCGLKARSRYRRSFRILREALPQQLADTGIQSAREANEFLRSYWEEFNRFVAIEPERSRSAFQPLCPTLEAATAAILGVHENPVVATANGAGYPGEQKRQSG